MWQDFVNHVPLLQVWLATVLCTAKFDAPAGLNPAKFDAPTSAYVIHCQQTQHLRIHMIQRSGQGHVLTK